MILSIINLLIYDFIKIEVKIICLIKFVVWLLGIAHRTRPIDSLPFIYQNFKM
jgi:hypothetical protein